MDTRDYGSGGKTFDPFVTLVELQFQMLLFCIQEVSTRNDITVSEYDVIFV